jgi:Ca2+-binding EF-hand superfamily protein
MGFDLTRPMPMSPLRRRKLDRAFEVLDVDGTGFASEEQSVRLGHEFARVSGYADTGPELERLTASIREAWRSLRDGHPVTPLDRDAFANQLAADLVHYPAKVVRLIGQLTNVVFSMTDRDNDGKITKAEVIRFSTTVSKVTLDEAEMAWNKTDAIGAGHLDYETCLKAFTEFVMSEDPEASGNWFLGRF